MTREEKRALLAERINKMENLKADKNVKCGGCLRKAKRQLRNLDK